MPATNPLSRSLGPISCVTITVPDLNAVEPAYTDFLDYRVVGRGRLTAELTGLWGCPAVTDNEYLLLGPDGNDDFVFRFVEIAAEADFQPFATYGWNGAEIIVKDVDGQAERLADSPFEIIGAPANLSFTDDIRAMQMIGPGQELLYLTEFKRPVPGLDTPQARCNVDRVFIVILAGPAMDKLQSFYAEHFNVPGAATVESRVKGMSAAFGLSPETKYPIAALPLSGQSLIEMDEMPAKASARPITEGSLPAGIAMVTFGGHGISNQATLISSSDAPYKGACDAICLTGPAGELIEVITPR